MCGKGSNTQTSNQTTTPNATAMEAYRDLLGRAQTVADTAYNPATQQQVAGFTAPQTQAFGAVNANLGAYQPYMTSAAQYGAMGAAPVTTTVANYMNPYTDAVVDATQRDFDVQNARQQSGVVGNARMAGSLGGDREAVAQALTAEAQNRTQAPIIANLRSQGYSTALGAAQADASRQLAASQQFANLGGLAQQYGYGDINALLQSGALQQGQQQRVLDAASANAAAESAYPFQTTQWLAGLEGAIGPAMGSTSRGTQTGPSPNTWSQVLGGGLALMSRLARGGRAEPRVGFAGGGAPGGGAGSLAGFPYTSAGYVPQIPLTGGQALQMMGQSQSPSRSGTTGGDALSSYRSTMDMFGAVNQAGNGLSQGLGNLASWGSTTSTPDGLGGAWSTSVTPSGFGGWGNFLSSLATGGRVGYADGGDVVDYTDAVSPASAFFVGAGGLPLDDGGANAGTFAAANGPREDPPAVDRAPERIPVTIRQPVPDEAAVVPFNGPRLRDPSPDSTQMQGMPRHMPRVPDLTDLPPVSDVAVADRAPAGVAYAPPGMTTGAVPAVPAGGAPVTGGAPTLADAPTQKSESWWSGFTKGLDSLIGPRGSPERRALATAGFAMMAAPRGGKGSFGMNVGTGGVAGMQAYDEARKADAEMALKQLQIASASDTLAATRALRADLNGGPATPAVGKALGVTSAGGGTMPAPIQGGGSSVMAPTNLAAHTASVAQLAPHVAGVAQTPQGPVAVSADNRPLFNIAGEYNVAKRMIASGVKEFVSAGETHMKLITTLMDKGIQPTVSGGAVPVEGVAEAAARAAALKSHAEHEAAFPYKVMESAVQQGARPQVLKPGETATTGTAINPSLQGIVDMALAQARAAQGGAGAAPVAAGPPAALAGAPASGPEPVESQPSHRVFPTGLVRNPDGSVSTRQTTEDVKLQDETAAEFKGAAEAYKNSTEVLTRLEGMDKAFDTLNASGKGWLSTGAFADTKFAIAKAGNSLAQSVGATPVFDPEKIASWEKLTKDTNNLGFALARTLGAREAASVVSNAVSSVPGAANTPLGAKMVLNSIREGAMRNADYYEFAQQYRITHGTLFGADIAFNKAHPPEAYARRAIDAAYSSFFGIKPEALAYLRAHPETRAEFDAAFSRPEMGLRNPSNAILGH